MLSTYSITFYLLQLFRNHLITFLASEFRHFTPDTRLASGDASRLRGMPRPKPAAAKGKDKRQAIEKDKVDVRESTRAKVDEILAQPLSAFVMFGFAQRNLLKKQKPNATPKEVVKAIGACSCAD